MVLRGQGDSPVRICEPCKKLEEAARFEKRHGHRNRAGRGGDSKLSSKYEDEIVNQILDDNGRDSLSPGQESKFNLVSSLQKATSGASSSSIKEDGGEDIIRSLSVDEPNPLWSDIGSASPEELRQQALDEKKKYKILKGERKPEEALKAFKRGKELERQAAALEIYLRKSRKRALSSSNMIDVQRVKDESEESKIISSSSQKVKDKDDIAAELKELGWSDMELRNADKKPASLSLEGELSTLVRETSQNSKTDKGTHGIDKTEVVALKRKALMLKREGNLAEAKEELRRAKILEKQLEEQELLGEAEDSDDELSLLIHSMDDDRPGEILVGKGPEPGFDFDHLMGVANDIGVDSNFEVTDEDMNDPEIAAALNSLGWTEDSNHPENIAAQSAHIDREALLSEIQSLKREALNKKRAGNTAEAMTLLKKAKLIERDLDGLDIQENDITVRDPVVIQKGSMSQTAEQLTVSKKNNGETVTEMEDLNPRVASKSKTIIQRELLGLKRKALTMRREGRLDEAEEELRKAKVLEQQLEEMDNASKVKVPEGIVIEKHSDASRTLDLKDEVEEEEDVTDQDMQDHSYLSLLKNMGWKDEDNEVVTFPSTSSKRSDNLAVQTGSSDSSSSSSVRVSSRRRSKADIQRELLGLKRKALALRRQGQTEEADEVLQLAKALEDEIAEMEAPKTDVPVKVVEHKDIETAKSNSGIGEGHAEDVKNIQEENNLRTVTSSSSVVITDAIITSVGQNDQNSSILSSKPLSSRDRFKLQQETLAHKRQALKLRREGRIEESEAEFKLAKALETQLEELGANGSMKSSITGAEPADNVGVEGIFDPQLLSALKAIGFEDTKVALQEPGRPESTKLSIGSSENSSKVALQEPGRPESTKIGIGSSANSSEERIQLEEQIKAEKVKAVNLKRSGKKAEALDALRRAKLLEKKLSSLASH